ncbi:hypothetical protein AOXY_G16768 [Acipenser oxyrinchus oxyrinchus]|uniref:Uncharacterized protein n=1 Tax=Acipenser oxyrinchus oxyrinchus TaxID=40147 RepID=A0AAD8D663_ACIOX|nr:hypothetical protein AOXY_G16768 [Acipenser oxyrinchus oxyrinchus]
MTASKRQHRMRRTSAGCLYEEAFPAALTRGVGSEEREHSSGYTHSINSGLTRSGAISGCLCLRRHGARSSSKLHGSIDDSIFHS